MTKTIYRTFGLTSCMAIAVVMGISPVAAQQTTPPLPIATPTMPSIPGMPDISSITPAQLQQMAPAQLQQLLQGAQGAQNIVQMLQGGQIDPGMIAGQLANLGQMAGIDTSQITQATQVLQGLQGMMQNGQIDPSVVQNVVSQITGGQDFSQLAGLMGSTNPAAMAETLTSVFGGAGAGGIGGGAGGSGGSGGGTGGGGGAGGGESYELQSKPVNGGPALGGCGPCADVGAKIKQHYTAVRQVIKNKFIEHREWIVNDYWKDHILPALMLMAEQLTVVGIQQVEIFGTMLDAKHQLETQRLFQQMTAQAHKDYQPSEGMCTFGTTVRSLAASERKSDMAQIAFASRMMQRQALSGDTVSFEGPGSDIESRLVYFARNFCDKADNSNGLDKLCKDAQTKPERKNIDVDYTRNIESRLTLNIDLADSEANSSSGALLRRQETAQQELTDEEEKLEELREILEDDSVDEAMKRAIRNSGIPDQQAVIAGKQQSVNQATNAYRNSQEFVDKEDVFALSANLFAHNVAPKILPEQLAASDGRIKRDAAEKYLDLRAVFAKRSVAQNSFAAMTAMRTSGDEGSAPYTKALIQELGVADEEEIDKLLGEKPSYFAQMEVLTKKIYQNPTFYTELYDKPVNVERKGAAIQAISLMQDRDLYNSLLRSEAVLSVLLETMLIREQEKVMAAMPRGE